MMKIGTQFAFAGLAAAAAAMAGSTWAATAENPSTLTCHYRVFSRCETGTATVSLLDGKVKEVAFESTLCGTQGKPARRCTVKSSVSGRDTWADADQGVRITFDHQDKPQWKGLDDELVVQADAGGAMVVDFSDTQPVAHCEGDAELPGKLVILKESTQCKAEF